MTSRSGSITSKALAQQAASVPLLILTLAALPVFGQAPGPGIFKADKGFLPYGSYNVSSTESVNEASGGLIFKVPLASLPPGRAGFSAGVNLIYNSQLFDIRTRAVDHRIEPLIQECSGVHANDGNCPGRINMLELSTTGGWRYSYNYAIEVDIRSENCTATDLDAINNVRTSINLPDGSNHLLRLRGYTGKDGYYPYLTDGSRWCGPDAGPALEPQDLHYYTTDGSFIQVTVHHAPNPQNSDTNQTWVAIFPDGTKVIGGGVGRGDVEVGQLFPAQYLCDRHENCVTIRNEPYIPANNETNQQERFPYTSITDAAERSIRITYKPAVCSGGPDCAASTDEITVPQYSSPGAATSSPDTQHSDPNVLKWTVNWTSIPIAALGYSCQKPGGTGALLSCHLPLGGFPLRVVNDITIPTGNGSLKYQFLYADNNTSTPEAEQGWGEIREIRFPNSPSSEATRTAYRWKYRSMLFRDATSSAHNYLTHKTLFYRDPLTNTNRHRRWQYEFVFSGALASSSTIKGPYDYSGSDEPPAGPPAGVPTQSNFFHVWCADFDCSGLKYKTELPEHTVIEQYWEKNEPWIGTGAIDKKNAYVRAEYKTLPGGSPTRTSAVLFDYDKNGNLTGKTEYDWVVSAVNGVPSGSALRTTVNSYVIGTAPATDAPVNTEANAYWNNYAQRYRGALKRTTVSGNGANTPAGITENVWDNAGTPRVVLEEYRWDSTKAPSQPAPATPLTTANAIRVQRTWSQGNLTSETDPDGLATVFEYDSLAGCSDKYTNLYPTKMTIGGVRSFTYTYDCATGVLKTRLETQTSLQDTYAYDRFARLETLTELGGARKGKTEYDDLARQVRVLSDRVNAGDLDKAAVYDFDQTGSLFRTRSNDEAGKPEMAGSAGIHTLAGEFLDATRRLTIVSNPFRPSANPAEGTEGWTVKTFDLEGRIRRLETFSGTALPAPWGSNGASTGATTFTYAGDITTTSDPSGRTTVAISDALGRLISVDQGAGSKATYTYDHFDNVTDVTQTDASTYAAQVGSVTQTREFRYTSLNRLKSAKNPESGTITYTYRNGGGLLTRTDARSATVTHSYEAAGLQRMTGKSYSGGTAPDVVATPAVKYCYDGQVYEGGNCVSLPGVRGTIGIQDYPKFQMTGYGSQVDGADAAQNYLTIDIYGRVRESRQRLRTGTNGNQPVVTEYPFRYGYQVDGSLTSLKYPSDKVVTFEVNPRDLVTGVSSSGGYYASQMLYTGSGAITRMKLGPTGAATQTWTPNSRGQFEHLEVTGPTGLLLGLDLDYGTNNNNGNLWAQTIRTGAQAYTQTYRYDAANRLRLALENAANTGSLETAGAPCSAFAASWCQRYGYDGFSNMWQQEKSAGSLVPGLKPNGSDWYWHAATSTVDNRLDGQVYDSGGQLQQYSEAASGGERAYYDGEGRIAQIQDATGTDWVWNWYDGEGLRIKRKVGSKTTWYVYDTAKQLMAEYEEGTGAGGSSPQYVIADHLGSTRALVNNAGGLVPGSRTDYAPFGGELLRTGVADYGTAALTRLRFTGQERDSESGLDYFLARYYSGVQGRFTSPDPLLASGRPQDPQSWNRYAYARNNPLVYIDPTGLDYEHLEGRQKKLIDEWAAAQNKANNTNASAKQMYNGLAESQRSTYEAVSHAMMKTAITDANGKTVGNALDLVGSITTIAGGVEDGGAGTGAKSDQQFRVYFDSTITSDKGSPLAGSTGFSAGQNVGFHQGYPNSFRSHGGKVPSLQLSMSANFGRGDGDIDYRQSGFVGLFNGHLSSANSDVRIGNNYQNHIKRFGPGLVDWWTKK